MTNLKFTLLFLLIAICSCGQKTPIHKTNPEAARLSNQIIPLIGYIDNADSCKKALSFLDSATVIDSNCFLCYYNKLMFLYPLKQYNKIISTIDECIRIRPNAHDLYLTAGILHEKFGDTISSKPYFTKSLRICNLVLDTMQANNRNYAMFTTNEAINLIMLGDSVQANKILTSLYQTQSNDSELDKAEKKYTFLLMNKSKAQLIDLLTDQEKISQGIFPEEK